MKPAPRYCTGVGDSDSTSAEISKAPIGCTSSSTAVSAAGSRGSELEMSIQPRT
jgi:hypothetical protein